MFQAQRARAAMKQTAKQVRSSPEPTARTQLYSTASAKQTTLRFLHWAEPCG